MAKIKSEVVIYKRVERYDLITRSYKIVVVPDRKIITFDDGSTIEIVNQES